MWRTERGGRAEAMTKGMGREWMAPKVSGAMVLSWLSSVPSRSAAIMRIRGGIGLRDWSRWGLRPQDLRGDARRHIVRANMNTIRIACVSYLNTRPLVAGLDEVPGVKTSYAVPARLLDTLLADECELAILPVIDYQRADDLVMVPASCIGADGHVQTVRLFSRVPYDQIKSVSADVESHTSVVLCRILLKQVYGIEPEIVPSAVYGHCDARLLIGDKVVCNAPA